MAKLLVTLDGVELREVRLSKDRTTIGRRSANDVAIDDRRVSGMHAAVCRCADHFELEDLDSTNGTFVNGEPIKSHALQFGDRIEIGAYRLKFLPECASETNGHIDASAAQPSPHRSSIQAPASSWPTLRILSGPNAGRELRLKKATARLGRPGHQIAVVTRRSTGCFIAHVSGEEFPMVNGTSLGSATHQLMPGDIIEVAGVWMMFFDDSHYETQAQHPQPQSEAISSAAVMEPITLSATPNIPAPRRPDAVGDRLPPEPVAKANVRNLPIRTPQKSRPSLPSATDRLRTLLNIRTLRSVPKRGPRPNAGARIFFEDLRMTVQAGMTGELWRWLQEEGWRELTYRPDRRRYCEIPTESVAELIECAEEERRNVLHSCIERAREDLQQIADAPLASTR
jgi:hypothetical protein